MQHSALAQTAMIALLSLLSLSVCFSLLAFILSFLVFSDSAEDQFDRSETFRISTRPVDDLRLIRRHAEQPRSDVLTPSLKDGVFTHPSPCCIKLRNDAICSCLHIAFAQTHGYATSALRGAVSSVLNLQTTQPTTAGAALCLGSSTIY